MESENESKEEAKSRLSNFGDADANPPAVVPKPLGA